MYGIETEYGVTCTLRGQRRLSPDEVARYLFRRVVSWGRSSNVFLVDGARRSRRRCSHPEYATAECGRSATSWSRRGRERILEQLLDSAEERPQDEPHRCSRCTIHLSAEQHRLGGQPRRRLPRELPHHSQRRRWPLVEVLIPFGNVAAPDLRRCRQGRCSTDRRARRSPSVSGPNTSGTVGRRRPPRRSRPIDQRGDEPHADAEHFRRLHVIVGDRHRGVHDLPEGRGHGDPAAHGRRPGGGET
ncbi:MAG: proteasome accessory factor PafA2 family protein [Acidimicrobiales bacterium]